MSFYTLQTNLRKSKSTGALDTSSFHCFNKSVDLTKQLLLDSVNNSQSEEISVLKQKIHTLKGMVKQQQCLLGTLKEDSKMSYNLKKIITDLFEESVKTLHEVEFLSEDVDSFHPAPPNSPASSLLAAIEQKHVQDVENNNMKDALFKLSSFLQSNEYREHFASTGAGAVSRRLDSCMEPAPRPYQALCEVGDGITLPLKSLSASNGQRDDTARMPKLILPPPASGAFGSRDYNNMHSLGLKLKVLIKQPQAELPCEQEDDEYGEPRNVPSSPPQPVDPKISTIDHLMLSALINKQIEEGYFDKSFEEALSYCNLSLVMAACRAADPAKVFNPCCLSQSVLLSLVQQLATDMIHETQLKCRYLEEALINLDVSSQVTRKHLPLVVSEVRKHLARFVRYYPNHVASRRIALIIMAADNLMK